MASATKRSETVTTITGVALELTLEEARTLAVVLAKVGGSPDYSARKYARSVLSALEGVGVTYYNAPEYDSIESTSGNIYFSDSPAVEG